MTDSEAIISVAEALARLLDEFQPAGVESVPVEHAVGRVLAYPMTAPFDYPRYPLSSMDGYAVRAEDTRLASPNHAETLRVMEDIPAGKMPTIEVGRGCAARIMTGAVLPAGADAVIPVESTSDNWRSHVGGNHPESVLVYLSVMPGDFVRQPGEDFHQGSPLLPVHRLRPQDIGILSMVGTSTVDVIRKPKVALVSTGDELLPVAAPLLPGKIYDTNSYVLTSLVEKYGGEVVFRQIAKDREEDVQIALDAAAKSEPHLILSSAGVSVGAFDYVRTVVERNGELKFWRVNMRPGKPLAFGRYREVPFIGLPGNPVSAFVGFEVFVRPVLWRLQKMDTKNRETVLVILDESITSDGRESYLRGVVTRRGVKYSGRLTGHQGSGNLLSLVQANALLIIPTGVKSLPVGSQVEAWLLDGRD